MDKNRHTGKRLQAKKTRDLESLNRKKAPMQDERRLKKISYIPEHLKGLIIGKGRENLYKISTDTGVKFEVRGSNLFMDGSPDAVRKAHIHIKNQLSMANVSKFSLLKPIKKVLFDSTNLTDEHELQIVSGGSHPWSGSHYKLQLLGEDAEQDHQLGQTEMEERLKDELLGVLKKLQRHDAKPKFELVLWCHFGHSLLGNVDEEYEGQVFSPKEVKQKLDKREWIGKFTTGSEDAEVAFLESALSKDARSSTYDVRHDFYFFTPSGRNVKVKIWLINEDELGNSMMFALNPPHGLRGKRRRVFCGKSTESPCSKDPCFFLWAHYQRLLRVDVVAPAAHFDCRFIMGANEKHPEPSPEDDEEDGVLCEYLSAMRVEENSVVLPPYSLLPQDFQLIFSRRSVRRTYEYLTDVGTFLLTVSRETQKEGDVVDQEGDAPTKTDVLLEFEDWLSKTEEDLFNPDYVASRFPDFVEFVRKVQTIIKLPTDR